MEKKRNKMQLRVWLMKVGTGSTGIMGRMVPFRVNLWQRANLSSLPGRERGKGQTSHFSAEKNARVHAV